MIRTKLSPFSPRYIWHENGLELKPGRLKEVARLVDDEGLKIVLHSGALLPFSEQGVKRGFHVSKEGMRMERLSYQSVRDRVLAWLLELSRLKIHMQIL